MSAVTRNAARTGRAVAVLRTRMRSRIVARERGDMLIETLFAMAIIAVTVAAFVSSAQASNRTQRLSVGTDVVAQHAQGVLEQAQSQPWDLLGFNPDYQPGVSAVDINTGAETVIVDQPISTDPTVALQPHTEDIEIRGVVMDQRVAITWDTDGLSHTDAGSYGTKVITITLVYTAPGDDTPRTKVYSAKRTSSVAEAVPGPLTSVATSDEHAVETPPRPCPSVSVSGNTASWNRIRGAVGYHVSWSGPTSGSATTGPNVLSYTAPYVPPPPDQPEVPYTFRVVAFWGDGWESLGC